jgi:hypothetical protein
MEQQLVLSSSEEAQTGLTASGKRNCFLPDTTIQYSWDSTSLELFKRCPRLYQYTMLEGWEPHGEGIHLRFGIEYHQALHDYETYKAMDLNHDEAVHATVKDLLKRIYDWDPDPRKESEEKKSKPNLLRTVIWYLDRFKDDKAETIILENGKPALEVSFRFELDWGPHRQPYTTTEELEKILNGPEGGPVGQPYLLSGHLDRIVNYLDGLYVMDRKTSGTALSTYYFAQYHPHNQMSLYALAGKIVLESPIRGVIIDGAQIANEYSEFQRGITYRTQDQLDEWLYDLHFWFGRAEEYAVEGYWPMNDTACSMYGGCRFREICSKSPQAREKFLQAGFRQKEEQDRWNPLKPR